MNNEDVLNKLVNAATSEAVYGKPVIQNDQAVITATECMTVAGYGSGSSKSGADQGVTGNGGGGGGYSMARPVAVITVGAKGVKVEPVVDATKIAIAALATFGSMVLLVMKMVRKHRW
jgi:uncharacterized spore protein YtfJ